jgi:hypothetical protein
VITRRHLLFAVAGGLRAQQRAQMDPTPASPVDPAAYFDGLARYKRIGIRLLPMAATAPLPLTASKIGGMILWPKAEPWPVMTRLQVAVVAQLRRDEFPEISFPAGADLLQLLWPPSFAAFGNDVDQKGNRRIGVITRWRKLVREDQCLSAPPPGISAEPGYAPKECVLHPERNVEYPSSLDDVFPVTTRWSDFAVPTAWRAIYSDFRNFWDEEIARAPGTKALGWGWWVQDGLFHPHCNTCGTKMTLLLTIASDSVELPERSARWATPYGASYSDLRRLYTETGIELAGSGCVYLHYCIRCANRPVVATMQFS